MNARKTRVLIVDDSLFMRSAIKKALEQSGEIEVVGMAKDGADGVARAAELRPDVITMDFNMPKMDGVAAVKEIMKQRPTPVVMLSAHTREGAKETFDALAAGAVDFLTKPGGEVSADLSSVARILVDKVVAAAGAVPRAFAALTKRAPRPGTDPLTRTWPPSGPKVAIIGVSTGGPQALSRVIPALSGEIPLALVIVQHMPAQFTAALAERLDAVSQIHVREARTGDKPRQGMALVAPGDHQLEVEDGGVLTVTDGPEVNGCRPSADVTMKSAARIFGRRALGVLMTGMGRDGAEGLAAIRAAGGKTYAQDKESCVIYGMPRVAVEMGVVDRVVPLDDLAGVLEKG